MTKKSKTIRVNHLLRLGICVALIALIALIGVVMAGAEEVTYSEGLAFKSNGNGTCYVTGIGSCTDTDIVIPPVSPAGDRVIAIGNGAFYNCENVTSIHIPNGVTNLGYAAFRDCRNLTSVILPESLRSFDSYVFFDCISLRDISIPEGVTSISFCAFEGCISLENVQIPKSITNIDPWAFSGCSSLTSIHIPENVKHIYGTAFSYCRNLDNITVDDGNMYYRSEGNCLIEIKTKTLLAGCSTSVIPTDGSVTTIDSHAFSDRIKLSELYIPECVTSIGYAAFSGCSNLTSVNIPEGITSIEDNLFMNCSSLASIRIPNSVTSVGISAFSGCTKLTQTESGVIYVGKWVVGYVGDITSVTLREGTVGICEAAFDGCHSLTDIHMPESVKYIGTSAFENCDQLTSVTVPSGVRKINWYVFASCERLAEIRLPDGLESIGLGAFYDCKSLTDIRIPATVQMIGYEAFDGCPDQLFRKEGGAIYVDTWVYYCADDTVYLRKDVAGFYWYAFGYETELYFLGTEKEWNALPGTDCMYKNCTVHCLGDLFDLTSASLTLGTSLTMNYYAKADPAYGTPAMRFTYRDKTETVMGVPTETEDEYVFSLKGIAPQCMGENIKAELILTLEDGTELVVDAKESYSVRAYCDDALAANPNNKTLATLLADLLAYGDAAQDYTGFNADTPVSEGFEVAPSEWEAVTDTDFTLSDKTRDDIRFASAGVRFGHINRLYFKLKAADLTGVTLTVNGKTYTAAALTLVEDTTDTYILYTDPIYATEFDKVFTAELSVDGEVIQTLTYSVKSYVYAKQNSENTEMAALVRALYAYGRSAIAYKQEQ